MSSSLSPAPVNQPVLFHWLRWRLLRTNCAELLRRSPVRLITILSCSGLIWAGLFALSLVSFSLLRVELRVPLDGEILGALFNLLFVVLTVLLVFSSGLILYSSLFASDE